MKSNNILRISVLPLLLMTAVMFTNMQPDKNKEKNNGKSQNSQSKSKGQDQKGNNKNAPKNNDQKPHGDNHENSDNKQKNSQKKKSHHQSNGHAGAANGNGNKSNENASTWKGNKSNGNSKMLNGKRDLNIDWNFANFTDRKHPKKQRKVTVCHNPSNDRLNGVNISISENALQAHLNHGDEIGNCDIDYSDRWSSRYVKSRENVYTTYEQAWETMSYSEILLKVAMEKLLGVRTNLNSTRATLTTDDIQRREALIYELQNNVNSLENQLGSTRQRLDSDVNILITL